MNVFIGGSRAVSRLNSIIRDKLGGLIRRQRMIFVGDANGVDKAVQQHLASRGYEHVTVAANDLAMARDAKCGMKLWDGKSQGTLNNLQQLIDAGKKALVYLAPEGTFNKLSTEDDLHDLLQRCDQDAIHSAQHQITTKLPAADLAPSH